MNKIEQLSYEFAGAIQSQRNVVSTLLSIDKNFATEMSDDTKAHLSKGLMLRYAENNPQIEQGYIKQGEAYVPVDDKAFKACKGDKVHLSVNFIMSESSAKFGRLKADNPALHSLLKAPRKAVQTYVSDTIRDMVALAKKMLSEASGETKTRAPNKDFAEKVAQHFEKMRTELISSKSRGDDTADEARFRKAVVAFQTVWSHG